MSTVTGSVGLPAWESIRSTAIAEQAEQQATYRRYVGWAVLVESMVLLVVSVSMITAAAGAGTDRALLLGFSYSYAQAGLIGGFAVAGLISLRGTRLLSRVAITKAVVFAALVEFEVRRTRSGRGPPTSPGSSC